MHKFQALNKKNRVISDIKLIDFKKGLVLLDEYPYGNIASLDEVELLPFTGMRDRYGEEIYDRDKVLAGGENLTRPLLMKVVFWPGQFMLVDIDEESDSNNHIPLSSFPVDSLKRVGSSCNA